MLLDYGKMDAESLLSKSEAAASERLQLRLRSGARRGEPEIMNQVRPRSGPAACITTCHAAGDAQRRPARPALESSTHSARASFLAVHLRRQPFIARDTNCSGHGAAIEAICTRLTRSGKHWRAERLAPRIGCAARAACPCPRGLSSCVCRALQVPLYAHVRETLDQRGQRDSVEIVYMKFFAYNGAYRVPIHGSATPHVSPQGLPGAQWLGQALHDLPALWSCPATTRVMSWRTPQNSGTRCSPDPEKR